VTFLVLPSHLKLKGMTGLFTHFSVIKEVKVLSCWSQVKCLQTRLKQVLLVAEQFGVPCNVRTTFSDTLLVTCSRIAACEMIIVRMFCVTVITS
jgi:hypothetical protein